MTAKLLSGYRIIEYSHTIGGMLCGKIFADMGAEVIKVEMPGDPEDLTRSEPPFVNGESLPFACANALKQCITLDFCKPEGKLLLEKLLKTADAFLVTRRGSDMEQLGFGYRDCKKLNHNLVYGSLTCFGLSGPFCEMDGGDLIAQAFSGCMSATGYPGGRPLRMGYPISENLGGMNLAAGIMAALFERNKSGSGQLVDISLVDSLVSSMCTCTGHYIVNGIMPRLGWSLAGTDDDPQHEKPTARGIFRARDGYVCISANHLPQLEKLYECMGMSGRLQSPEFQEKAKRLTLCGAINSDVDGWISQFTKYEAFQRICGCGVAAAPLLDYAEVYENCDIRENRKMFKKILHPVIGEMIVTDFPVKVTE